jgi:predicted transcriptional regulator
MTTGPGRVTPLEVAGIVGLGVLALAAIFIANGVRHAAAAAAYARIQPPEILDNDLRNRIYQIVVNRPGMSAREVQRQSGASWGTVVYHLRQLEHHRLLRSQGVGRARAFYEAGPRLAGLETGLALLWNERLATVAREVLRTPGTTQEALVASTSIPQRTVSHYLQKLEAAGLVRETRDGRRASYFPEETLARALDEGRSALHAPMGQALSS